LRDRSATERDQLNAERRADYATNLVRQEQAKATSARYRADPAHAPAIAEGARRYYASEKGKAVKRAGLLRKFNMTPADYDERLAAQGGVCAICRQPETHRHRGTGPVVALSIDHDHRCCPGTGSCGNCVRGLLCDRCNVGRFPDDPALLRAAADYFERYAR